MFLFVLATETAEPGTTAGIVGRPYYACNKNRTSPGMSALIRVVLTPLLGEVLMKNLEQGIRKLIARVLLLAFSP